MTFHKKQHAGWRAAAGAVALSLAMVTSACGDNAADTATEEVEGVIPGITITDARMVLAPVEGNPAAIYFNFVYDGDRAFSLDRFSVEGAESAVMHEYGEYNFKVQMMEALPVPVKKGETLEFAPGARHVMAMGVSPDLKPGDTTEVTMKVSGGKTHSFDVEVRAAGEER